MRWDIEKRNGSRRRRRKKKVYRNPGVVDVAVVVVPFGGGINKWIVLWNATISRGVTVMNRINTHTNRNRQRKKWKKKKKNAKVFLSEGRLPRRPDAQIITDFVCVLEWNGHHRHRHRFFFFFPRELRNDRIQSMGKSFPPSAQK